MRKAILGAVFLVLLTWCGSALAQQYNAFQIQFVDWDGQPCNMGTSVSITFYVTGTATPLTVYKDTAGTVCTSPITDNSTNTPLLYTEGLMKIYVRARSFKMTVTDGTYTTSYDPINTSSSLRWPPPGVASSGTSLGQNDDLDFAFAGIILDGDTAGQLELIPDSDGGIWKIGDATKQMDLYWYTGNGSNYIFFDEGSELVSFVDEDALFDDDAILKFGTDSDFSVKSNAAKTLNILPVTTDESSTINFGANTAGVNLNVYPATTGDYMAFVATGSGYLGFEDTAVSLGDGTKILFGDALGTGDLYLESTTNVLTVGQVVAGTGEVRFGVNDAGLDVKLFGDTAGEYLLWDTDADTLTVVGGNATVTTNDAEANQFKVDATGAVAGNAIVFETTNGGVQFNVDGAANGDLDIDADSTVDVNALDDITITVASNGAGEDLSLVLTGANDASILLTSAGTGVDAIGLSATAGTVKIAGDKLDLDTTNDFDLTVTSSTDAEDLSITQSGANDSHLTLTAGGTSANALGIQASGGGIDLDAAANKILDIDAGTVQIDSKTAGAGAIALTVNQGAADTMVLTNTQGNTAAAITLVATAGGIDMDGGAGGDIAVTSTGKSVVVTATEAAADAVVLSASGGGIDLTSAATYDIDITATGGKVLITGNEDAAGAISLLTSGGGGTSETIVVTNDQGNGDASIDIDSTAGGVDVDAAKSITLTTTEDSADGVAILHTNGGVDITAASNDAGDDIDIAVTGATDSHLKLTSSGTSADALLLAASAGGIDIDGAAGGDIAITSTGKSVVVTATEAAADAITLTVSDAAGGVDINFGTGNLDIDGTGASADFTLDADLFSIDGTGASNITVTSNAGSEDFTIALAGATDSHLVLSSTGTSADALQITASAGDILVTPNAAVSFADKNITNVGVIDVDKIRDDATSTIIYTCKTRKLTLGHPGDAGKDFVFASAANHDAQNMDFGAVIPAHARVLDVTIICTETMVGESDINFLAGNASAGNQFVTTASCDDENETAACAAGGTAWVAASNAAQNLWIQGDPSDNTWADMTAGAWTILITYLDLTAAE